MNEQKQLQAQMIIKDGTNMASDEASVMSNPLRITFDFKNISPRFDARNNEFQPIIVEHTTVTMDPWQAKEFANILNNHLSTYEKQFGEIKKPEVLAKFEEMMKNTPVLANENVQTYFG